MPVRFSVEDVRLLKVHFELAPNTDRIEDQDTGEDSEGPLEIAFTCSTHYSKEERTLRVILGASTVDSGADFLLQIEVGGMFVFDSDPTEEELQQLSKINCPAIIYPYLREHISDLMRRAELDPIYLPVMNFSGLKDKPSREVALTEE